MSDFSLIDLFRAEVESHGAALSDGLLALESKPGDPATLETLMRSAHSIKGAARIVGLDTVVTLAHAMEDAFVAAQEGKFTLTAAHVDVLLRAVDFFAKLKVLPEEEINPWLTAQEGELQSLQGEIRQFLGEEAPPAAVAESTAASVPIPAPEAEPAPVAPVVPVATTTAAPTPAPATAPAPAEKTESAEDRNKAVRVTAETLDQLLSIAAETLVETSHLEPYVGNLETIRKAQIRLAGLLSEMHTSMATGIPPEEAEALWHEAHRRLNDTIRLIAQRTIELEAYTQRATSLTERLYRQVIVSRMRPFREGTIAFPRMVRDLARRLGKNVKLEILGQDTLVDRDSLEKLEAPLGHIVRNALDHGIELPAEREQAGKPVEAVLRLEARHHAGRLNISISDTGRGIDVNRLRTKATEKGLVTEEMARGLSDAELFEFLFLPGFSTSERITDISGRGVGLDVVHATVQELGGTVSIQSQPGVGTTFLLQLPVTRSVIRALLATIGGEPYAFPLARIERMFKTTLAELEMENDRVGFRLDGAFIPLVSATEVLGLPPEDSPRQEIGIVVVGNRERRYGVEVDAFIGERRVVVRPLDPRLGKVPDISAASVLEDGRALLILDVDDLVCSIEAQMSGGSLSRTRRQSDAVEQKKTKHVLVVDDSVTVRELERKLLEAAGYQVDSAVDGMEGWNSVRLGDYDLVISDIDMPRMNGIELVRHIRQDARLKALPVVIVSYKDREEDRLRGLDAGANYYLTKSSFHDASLIHAVVDLIGESHA
ncbi:MAG: hypothetical protein B9S32_02290 [Verrucomicrobia bacterium Tous-C9LFEB]|nr:MAG: hypothetical protein B9S32_02290 [Verrucomicrobia bacterium Tous-C9LFEB]